LGTPLGFAGSAPAREGAARHARVLVGTGVSILVCARPALSDPALFGRAGRAVSAALGLSEGGCLWGTGWLWGAHGARGAGVGGLGG